MSKPGQKAPQPEPPMEEILASIRRIIAEENEGAKTSAPDREAMKRLEVLELTEIVAEDGKVASLKSESPAGQPAATAAPAASRPSEAPASPAVAQSSASEAASPSKVSRLASGNTVTSVTGAMRDLHALTRQREAKQEEEPMTNGMPLGNATRTLEDLVREEIRPILTAWLDQNLPPLVERLVQKEIKRITRDLDEA